RAPVSPCDGVRFRCSRSRRGAWRHGSEIQSAHRSRDATAVRATIADRADDADPRRLRRRAEDVEIAWQCRWHQGAPAGDVRQADVDLRRTDVALLDAA